MEQQQQHTCITCGVVFKDANLQRNHYKTDWHRYNLKRKVAEMAPVTLANFQLKMEKHQEQIMVLSGEVKQPTGYCVCCRKSFNNERAYENHINSKKHKAVASQFQKKDGKDAIEQNRLNRKASESVAEEDGEDDEDMEVEEVDSDEWDDLDAGDSISVDTCLFCVHRSKDIEKNLIHMTEGHSFFLPDAEYLVDLKGLMGYLGEKVGQGYMCLWCNDRSKAFQTVSAVQQHMVDKGHCRLKHEGDSFVEYARFYDYSTSYPEGEYSDEVEEEVELNAIDDSGYELVLPSGARVGHRSLMRYYKQSLNPDRQLQPHKSMNRVLSHYNALGWTGLTGADAKKKARDIKFMRHVQQKHHMKLGNVGNYTLRHRFRDPNM